MILFLPAYIGDWLVRMLAPVGAFTRFALSVVGWTLASPGTWLNRRRIAPPIFTVGVASIPVVATTGMFIGMILALEGFAVDPIRNLVVPRFVACVVMTPILTM